MEVFNSTNSVTKIDFSEVGLDTLEHAVADETSVYLYGKDQSGLDTLNRLTRGLPSLNVFGKNLSVTSNGLVILSLDKYQIAKMAPNGTIFASGFEEETIAIARLN